MIGALRVNLLYYKSDYDNCLKLSLLEKNYIVIFLGGLNSVKKRVIKCLPFCYIIVIIRTAWKEYF